MRKADLEAEPMTEAERNKHTNLILLCGDHHKLIVIGFGSDYPTVLKIGRWYP